MSNKKLIPKDEFADTLKDGNTDAWQLAEYFNLSKQLVLKAFKYYNISEI